MTAQWKTVIECTPRITPIAPQTVVSSSLSPSESKDLLPSHHGKSTLQEPKALKDHTRKDALHKLSIVYIYICKQVLLDS